MTKKEKQTYLRADGVFCPFCKSLDIEGGSVEINSGTASQEIHCLNCDKKWADLYHLVDVEEIK
jgi:hypothetical protein